MRKYLFFLLFLCVGFAARAQQSRRGALTVVSRQPVMIAIDNRLYDVAGTELTIGNIPRGSHNLKIYQPRYRSASTEEGRPSPGYLLFETFVRVRPDNNTVAIYNHRSGTLRISNRAPGEPPFGTEESQPRQEGRQQEEENDDIYSYPPQENEVQQAAPDHETLPYQLTDQQLKDLTAQISQLSSDTKKKEKLQSVLGMKTYTVAQLKEMATWLEFESERLDFLKWAYTNTEDKANYSLLNELFRYESSKKELSDYVQQQQ